MAWVCTPWKDKACLKCANTYTLYVFQVTIVVTGKIEVTVETLNDWQIPYSFTVSDWQICWVLAVQKNPRSNSLHYYSWWPASKIFFKKIISLRLSVVDRTSSSKVTKLVVDDCEADGILVVLVSDAIWAPSVDVDWTLGPYVDWTAKIKRKTRT